MKFDEKVEEIKKKVGKTSIYIGRIPEKDKTEFKKIADEEFEGDYGFALREMKNTWKGIYVDPNETLQAKIDLLAYEVAELKKIVFQEKNKKEEPSGIRMLNGRIIGGKKNE